MNWSEIFYPGNPERKEKLIRKSQQFIDLMEDNFTATNDLVELLNEFVGLSLKPVILNEKNTLRENCDVLIKCIREIQAELQKFDKELKEKLDPAVYEKVKNIDLALEFNLNMPEYAKVAEVVFGVAGCVSSGVSGCVAAVVVCWLIKRESVLEKTSFQFDQMGSMIISALPTGVVFSGIGIIFGAIMGRFERDKLEKALKEYDEALDNFKPASKQYQYSITEARIRIDLMKEKTNPDPNSNKT
nr:single-pass membrane and coiled-coil domain-containing protein 3-like [Misgurnus anguillicaudatus]